MSRSVLKKKIYDLKDFKEATRLERLYIHLMQPYDFHLNDPDEEYLEKLRQAFVILNRELSRAKALRKLQKLYPESKNDSLYRIINDTQELFGSVIDTNKKFDRHVLVEKLALLAKENEKGAKTIDLYGNEHRVPNLEEARKCYEAIGKIKQLDKPDSEIQDAEEYVLPKITFTDNPKALGDGQIEDVEYEES